MTIWTRELGLTYLEPAVPQQYSFLLSTITESGHSWDS